MPTYTLDPEQLAAEIRALPVTDEPTAPLGNGAATPEDVALIAECYDTLLEGSPRTIHRLTALTTRYPDDPALKNHLGTAYSAAGNERQARHLSQRLRQEHPDYLFGRLNEASDCLLDGDAGELERVPELLGETLRLQDREPDRELFHISEVKCFYTVVAHFHLRSGRPELAEAIHEVLEAMIEDRDLALLQLKRDILTDSLARLKARIAADDARAIRVRVPPPPDTAAPSDRPDFHHAEIEDLYRHALDLPRSRLAAILALPRESVIADLEAVLRDSLDRGPLFLEEHIDFENEEIYFPIHAIFVLGELRAADSLPLVLEVLSQHPDVLDFWFGDMLHEDLWEPLYHLVDGQLDVARRWMTSPGTPAASRGVLAGALVQIALHQPDRREEVIAWFRGILEFFLESPPEDNILDTRLVTSLVSCLMDLRASELLPLVTALVEKDYVAASQVGELDAIREELSAPPDMAYRQPLLRVANRYRSFLGPAERPSHVEESLVGSPAFFPRLSPASLSAPSAKPKVGRNDPCPCGSGMKYKKCCL